jgi:hypothetical protein
MTFFRRASIALFLAVSSLSLGSAAWSQDVVRARIFDSTREYEVTADGGPPMFWVEGVGKYEGVVAFVANDQFFHSLPDIELPVRRFVRKDICLLPLNVTVWSERKDYVRPLLRALDCVDKNDTELMDVYSRSKYFRVVPYVDGEARQRVGLRIGDVEVSLYWTSSPMTTSRFRSETASNNRSGLTIYVRGESIAIILGDNLLVGTGPCTQKLAKALELADQELTDRWILSFYRAIANAQRNGSLGPQVTSSFPSSCGVPDQRILGEATA